MSVRDVADLLALAHQGVLTARESDDEELRRRAMQVAARAFRHPEAAAFFGALNLALAEVEEKPFGNDEGADDTGAAPLDESSPAASPVYEGVTDGDDDGDMDSPDDESESTDEEDQNDEAMSTSGIILSCRPVNSSLAAATNIARLLGSAATTPSAGKLLVQEFKTAEGAAKRARFENAHSDTHVYRVEKTGESTWQLRKVKRG